MFNVLVGGVVGLDFTYAEFAQLALANSPCAKSTKKKNYYCYY